MSALKNAFVNLFKSLTGLVAREVKALEQRVADLEAKLAGKVNDAATSVDQKATPPAPPAV